ncbi:MAG: hypothetical protein KatS3mg076_2825 [Candidatus Binatia bacterium]|nr:MAG: hypothetical protein KatS3mg076_2825 [Candidatus Binatia bacterium]
MGSWIERIRSAIRPELLRDTAVPVLVLRVLEGLSAWIVFDLVYLRVASHGEWVHGALVAYLLGNLVVALAYLGGRATAGWLVVDLGFNLVPISVVVHASGGPLSPLAVLYLLKIAGYLVLFGLEIGVASILAVVVLGLGWILADVRGLWETTPPEAIPPPLLWRISLGARLAFVAFLLVGAAILVRQIRLREDEARLAAERDRAEAARLRRAYELAVPQVVVSEAVSRLTTIAEVCRTVVALVPRLLDVDIAGIFVWDADEECYRGGALYGVDARTAEAFGRLRLGRRAVPDLEWVRHLRKSSVVPGVPGPLGPHTGSAALLVPLQSDEFFGILFLARRRREASFTQHDIAVANGIAPHVAMAMERAALIEQGARLVQALESTDEAVFLSDARGRIVYANPAVLRLFQFGSDEVLGREAVKVFPELSLRWGFEPQSGETFLRRKDGSSVPVVFHLNPIHDGEGKVNGLVAILEDASERKRMEEQLQRADRLATAGEMAAGIAHDVNNALVALLRHVARGEKAETADEMRAVLAEIRRHAKRIGDVAAQLLDFARPREPARREVSARALLQETLALQRYELDRAGIEVDVCVAEDATLWVDPKQIEQLLVNLITNARQALEGRAQPRISLSVERTDHAALLRVEDNGPGIPPEKLHRVFDPFFTTKPSGTGLGLTVADRIARDHGGELSVESREGRTVFTLRLPLPAPRAQKRALVVDDDPEVARSFVEMLGETGLDAEWVGSGREAVDRLLENDEFDVVFLDLRLPDLPGIEVYSRLREKRAEQARKIVFVTGGLWRSGTATLSEELPPQPILRKPCTPESLRRVLDELALRAAA